MAKEQAKKNKQTTLTALTAGELAKLLTQNGQSEVSDAMVQADIKAGAPTNPDGTINLIHYAAWVVKDLSSRGD